MNEQPT